jgi:predicted nuclease of predicted toxin-antitoxin system
MAARFKVDENLPREAQALLLDAGHDAQTVHDERLVGGPDAKILDLSIDEDRVLVTLDLDFSDIRQYPPSRHRGVWVLRPRTQSIENSLSVLRGALALAVTSRLRIVSGLWSQAVFVSASNLRGRAQPAVRGERRRAPLFGSLLPSVVGAPSTATFGIALGVPKRPDDGNKAGIRYLGKR